MDNSSSLIDLLIKDEVRGTPRHEILVILGPTPQLLQQHAGFPDIEMAITGKVISKACFDHGINTSVLKRLEDIINTPKAVYRPADPSKTDSIVVLTYEIQGHAPVIIPIRQSQRVGRNGVYNLVTSIYGKEGPDPETKWDKDGLTLWKDK